MIELKTVQPERWALVDVRTLAVHTPWIKGDGATAVEFAHKHCRGWDLEGGLEVTDWDSYKRLRFQKYEIPRMVEAKRKKRAHARTAADLVEFHPFRAELKKATGEKRIW